MSKSLNTIIRECLKPLVTNSLMKNASRICIRFHKKTLRLFVCDDGEGLSFDDLQHLGIQEENSEFTSSQSLQLFEKKLIKLRELSISVGVMSRHKDNDTFVKIIRTNEILECRRISQWPKPGTIIILRFSRDDIHDMNISISELKTIVGSFALNNPEVFFTLQTDGTAEKVQIKKQNEPMNTLQIICNHLLDPERIQYFQNEKIKDRVISGYFGYDCSREIIQKIFLNNEEVNCPEIVEIVTTNYINTVNSYGSRNNLAFNLKREKILLLLYINSPDCLLQNLIKDEGFLDTVELRVIRAVSLQLKTISIKMLQHIFPLTIRGQVSKNPKALKKRKIEAKTSVSKKKFLPDLRNISLPLLSFTCKQSRLSKTRRQSSRERLNENGVEWINNRGEGKSDGISLLVTNSGEAKRNLSCQLNQGEAFATVGNDTKSWEISYALDDLGEWSDWNYEDSPNREFNQQKYYDFLPQKLRHLIPATQSLTRGHLVQQSKTMGFKWNRAEQKIEQIQLARRQDSRVRPCKNSQSKRMEITLQKAILKNMKVLRQVNKEFIAGVAEYENKKYLLLIDQHAMDERIRYEALLKEYRCNQNTLLRSHLHRQLEIIDLPERIMSSILLNSQVLIRFGVTFKRQSENSVTVSTIPNCFLSKKRNNLVNMVSSVKELIFEIGEKLISRSGVTCLPIAIHNAIASEACHGAIRFGDALNRNQCDAVVSHWIETDLPNRCAHGRPAVIPLLEISAYRQRYHQVFREKLSFESLKKQRK
ncbi:uncharacterized protein [Fopius arisanus]|uniref:Uncharacterized protein isoform X2 n=1 Tax=Fopius arisanus TaxID=64838 RepID=A0A9R1U3J0_9HYME|nr:PREDICTED: uncharacterized protein LOC105268365 isoform X2 [Fopius arisanus]